MRWIARFGLLGTAVTLAACSSTGPSDVDTMVSLDVAVVAAEAAAQDVEVMRGPGGPLGFGMRADPGSFNCEPVARQGVTITRTCTYKDAAGNVQSAYDPVSTASVSVHTEIQGSLERDRWSATMSRTTDLTVTGLANAETSMTWNGSASGTMTRVRHTADGDARQYAMAHTGRITDVVIPVPRTENSWPLSGTITRSMSVTFTGGPRDGDTVERTVSIQFNGTRMVTLTVNGQTFEFDLASRGRPGHQGHRP